MYNRVVTVTLCLILILKSSELNTIKINDSALHVHYKFLSIIITGNIIKLIVFIVSFAMFLLAVSARWLSSIFQEKQSADQTQLCSHK